MKRMILGLTATAVLVMACAPVQTGPGYYREPDVVVVHETTTYHPETCTIHVVGEISSAETRARVRECQEHARYTGVPPIIEFVDH